MFGQKPQLPVDLLLGQADEEPALTTPDDWVTKHQDHLASVYVTARKQLETSAKSRERQQSPTTMSILPVGTLVYRKNHVPGRCKIQDVWDSTVYQVVKCLDNVGTVYKVQSQNNPGQQKNIHRAELRLITTNGAHVSKPLTVPSPPAIREEAPSPREATEDDSDNSFVVLPNKHLSQPQNQRSPGPVDINPMITEPEQGPNGSWAPEACTGPIQDEWELAAGNGSQSP